MKKYTNFIVLLAVLMLIYPIYISAKNDDGILQNLKDNPALLSNSGYEGTQFYLTFPPALLTDENSQYKLYVYSQVATKVTVEIPSKNITIEKDIEANGFDAITLTPDEALIYSKKANKAPLVGQVWDNAAIRVYSDDPIIVYAMLESATANGGYLVLPKHSLGLFYQVSTYADPADNKTEWKPSYTSVLGIYDNTRITIKMGGCDSCYADNNSETLKSYQTIRFNINEGDVFLMPSKGANSDLSGTTVKANKPISVISGNYSANIPVSIDSSNFTIEQELPENTWGTKYHITPIFNRDKKSIVRIYTNKPNTNIYLNNVLQGTISYAGGILSLGYLSMTVGELDANGNALPIEISADNPIQVVQYNFSVKFSSPALEYPFQLPLVSLENYSNDITLIVPPSEQKYFANIVYLADESGKLPDDVMIGELIEGTFVWKRLDTYSVVQDVATISEDNGRFYRVRTIRLSGDRVYNIKSDNKLMAYYFGDLAKSSLGLKSSSSIHPFEAKNDTFAPSAEFVQNCDGTISGIVYDEPRNDEENRSNLGLVYMMTDDSYNFSFSVDNFIVGIDYRVNWILKVRNKTFDGRAHIVFIDVNGNRTDTIITYKSMNTAILPSNNDFGKFKLETPNEEKIIEFTLQNYGENSIPAEYDFAIVFDSNLEEYKEGDIRSNQNFEFEGFTGNILTPFEAGQETKFRVKFTAREVGTFRDSIGIMITDKSNGTLCRLQYLAELNAKVGSDEFSLKRENDKPYQVCENSTVEIGNDINIVFEDNEIANIEDYLFEWINIGEDYGEVDNDNSHSTIFQSKTYDDNEDRIAYYRLVASEINNLANQNSIDIAIKILKLPKVEYTLKQIENNEGTLANIIITSRPDWIYKFYDTEDAQIETSRLTKAGGLEWQTELLKSEISFWVEAVRVEDNSCKSERIEIKIIPTSVEDNYLKQASLYIYPNPAEDYINISIDSEAGLLNNEVQILDLLGLVVSKFELTNGNNRIDISNLPRGTYFIKIDDKIEKFVKLN